MLLWERDGTVNRKHLAPQRTISAAEASRLTTANKFDIWSRRNPRQLTYARK